MVMTDTPETVETLLALRNRNVGICVDDFGTGYSSLAYLQTFPIDRIKIDRAFVKTLSSPTSDRKLVAGITAIASALGVETVAEGVETELQFEHLLAVHCTKAQGYLFGRPTSAEAVERDVLAPLVAESTSPRVRTA
jgi:EAL domain-containing protein (putative c-di-GMP-specific phosphodiesterase class I)